MKLSVNIDHVATIREARGGLYPDPVQAAVLAEISGAHGIVAHLREDRRHINDRDIIRLQEVVTKKFDLEMALTPEIVQIALSIGPDMVTLVPEKREELTTEGGLNIVTAESQIREAVDEFHDRGISVSLFVEPDRSQLQAASRTGADMVELHTGAYANSRTRIEANDHITRLTIATDEARQLGLLVKAGHGLSLENLAPIAAIEGIEEVSIGHALIGRAVFVGMERAVLEYLAVLASAEG
ncbi:MAG: pyridoxine 5'-phosphate synthase [Chlorobi bacterium]|nr:MAG: pyridoxine 5'-phosphate synthase [Bacteroidota bacterium]KXK34991.1 MAG: pyridoxal phosphate biosynthesis protein [Chlorobi bacterium OLB6]MBE2265168.1 pyridoxine 5'-phosphate synthase [Flavobacteriales bacterium]MBL1161969.1 pyridoxine 5'-phosphate synthase [Chlorobiota bacterium]MBW7854484.1 pyridoxine 5'-phosphate synthase [Candidatus Kapabacteria bacterium]MCC6331761.1 pyridoxine 5'-phosphate synthase [Ignavibacteria bacterium]